MELLGIYQTVYDAKKAVQQQCGVSGGIAVITSNPDDIEEISRYAGYRIKGIYLQTEIHLLDELKALVSRKTAPEKLLEEVLELGVPKEIATRYVGAAANGKIVVLKNRK